MHIVAIYVLLAIVSIAVQIILEVTFDSVHIHLFIFFLKYTFCMMILIAEL